MLIKLSEYMKPVKPLSQPHKGLVVDNEDPKKLGRVKCTVDKIFEGAKENLPWIQTENNPKNLDVPKIGAELIIEFPFNDIYSPFYTGYWNSKTDAYLGDNYPNTFGFTKDNLKSRFDDKTKIGEIEHSSGTKVGIADDGTVTITGAKDLIFTIAENLTITSDKKISFTSTEELELTSEKDMTLKSSKKFVVDATMDVNIESGTKTTIKSATMQVFDAPITKLGTAAAFHATISENLVSYNDTHIHPPIPPLVGGPVLPPVVKMSDKAGTVLDVVALTIFIKGNA